MQENDVTNGSTATFTFTNVYKKFKVELTKTAQGSTVNVWSGTSLAGAEYTLYKNGTKVKTYTTDANGKFTTDVYICGEGWTIKETKAPQGFALDPTVYTIGAVRASQNTEERTDKVTSDEDVLPGKIVIQKKMETPPTGYTVTNITLDGFQFKVEGTLDDGTKYNKTFTTDANGKITVDGLMPGTYTVTEVANGKTTPFIIPEKQEQSLAADKTITYTFNQVRKKFELTLTKVDKYGKSYPDFPLSGAEYTVYKNGAPVKTYTTDANGKLTTDTYWEDTGWTIKETKAPNGYQPDPTEYSFGTVDSAQTIEVTNPKLTSEEEPKPADVTITKVFEDLSNVGYVLTDTNKAGFKFHVTGTLDNGETYDETFETDENGQIILTGLIPGTYTIEEIKVPGITDNYILPEPQTFTVLPQDDLEKKFDQTYKKFQFALTKVDADGLERTDAKLAGAEYTLYKGGEVVKVYTTDENGQFTSDVYVCDSDYVVKETLASEGYKLDETEYPVGKIEGTQDIEIRNEEIESREEIVTGKIMINKVTDEGIEAEIIPEEGAQFEIYLRAAGSYDAALETERDILTINKYGFAISKELPYGVYTVHQTFSWDGRKLTDDFDVVIDANSDPDEPYYYLLENETFRSYIQVVKTDAETGETIPFAGATFEIYDANGELVTIQITYPSKQTLTSFVTDDSGTFITPIRLPYGEYTLKEIKAPKGYLLYTEPIPFTVNEENAQEDEGLMLITITVPNGPEKGQLTVTKEGEVFASVEQDGDQYMPVYTVMPLAGATFEITAATDIYTPDGTLRAEKGEVVDTITTGEDGTATSVELYLGKYEVRETSAPYGMVLNEEVQTVEFVYGGQEVEVVFEQASFTNERQKFELSILKEMQADEDGNIDLDAALLNVEFSLYAREEMVAADGLSSEGTKTIPADGLLETASPDEEGKISFNVDLPVDAKVYVKETATDSHYILDEGEYDLETAYAGQDKDVIELVFNDGDPVTNIPVEIKTTLESDENHALDETKKTAVVYGDVTLVDTVTYEGLVPGKAYIMTGILMDKATGEEWKVDGETVTASEVFTPTEANGTVDITFTFKGIAVKEVTSVVAFETLYEKESGAEVAVHTDIEDEDQTVELVEPKIGTTALIDGKKVVGATETFDLVDTVSYENLVPGKEYVLYAKLMDKKTGEVFREITASYVFTAEEANGTVDVTFPVDLLGLTEDTELVAFEALYIRLEDEEENTEEVLVTDHEDLEDEGQTVTVEVPEIHTNATVDDGKRETVSVDIHEIVDEVSYRGLAVGKEYVVSGTLMDKDTGKPILIDGKEVTAETTFTAEKSEGTVTVIFHVDLTGLETDTIVVFEDLYRNEVKIAIHADIEDENQTIIVDHPEIGTVAQIDDMKTVGATETFELVDTVEYKNLNPGAEYTVRGILMDAATGEAFLVDGKEVTAEATFTAAEKDGTVDVIFTLPTVGLTKETKLAAFEQLFIVKSAMEGEEIEETLVTEHEDITDEDQTVTVTVPEIRTSALVDGEKETAAVTVREIVDTVMYSGLTPGREYTVSGVLMDKATGEAFLVDGKEITASTTFIAENADGTVDVIFEVDLNGLELETTLVVFETLYRNEIEIAIHADIDDEDQSDLVKIPEIRTSASIDGMKTVGATETFDLVDTVSYKNLLPGMTYIVRGKLMDKATGKPLLIDGKEVTAETEFVAEKEEGTVEVIFKLNAAALTEETELVVFEKLYVVDGELVRFVTFHEDIEDEDQTVKVTIPEIGTTATVDGEHETDAIGVVELKDVVEYKGLTVGKEYTVSGILMDKATNKPFLVNGEEVTAETTFTAKTADGSVELTFEVDLSNVKKKIEIVAFETLLREDVEIAIHADIEDEDQTVVVYPVPVMHTTVSVNGKESTDEKHVELIQAADKTTVAVKDTIYYECFVGGTYLLEGKLVKVEDNGKLVIIAETSQIVTVEEYKAGEWVLDFGELKLEIGKYVVFEKATPVTVEEKPNPDKPEEKIEEVTPTGPSIEHENPDDKSQTFVIVSVPQTGDSFEFISYVVLAAAAGTGVVLLTRKRRKRAEKSKEV